MASLVNLLEIPSLTAIICIYKDSINEIFSSHFFFQNQNKFISS